MVCKKRAVIRLTIAISSLLLLCCASAFPLQKGKPRPKPAETTVPAGETGSTAQAAAEQNAGSAIAPAAHEAAVAQPPGDKVAVQESAEKAAASSSSQSSSPRSRNVAAARTEGVPAIQPIVPPQAEPEAAATTSRPDSGSEPAAAVQPSGSSAVNSPALAGLPLPAQESGWADLVKALGGVGLVISMIFGGYLMFRKFAPQFIAKRAAERTLRIVESVSMGDKRSIAIVEAGSRQFLVASTPGQITLLTALSDKEPNAAAESPVTEAKVGARFRNLYELEKKSAPVRPAARPEIPADIRGKMQQLRKALEG